MKQALRYNNKVVKKIYQGTELVKKIDKVSVNRYSKQYLTIESTSDDNTISWKSSASSLLTTISASTDNGVTWTEYTAKVGGTALATLNTGDKLLVKGENSCYSNSWIGWRGGDNRFSSTNAFEVKGNIMSLVSGDSFANADKLTASYTFHGLFLGCTHLTSAENLILPATTLASTCYSYMFRGCTSLTTAPQLPAMNLTESCYFGMFYGCSNLTKAPELPATTLVRYCYQQMFVNCRKLNYIKCLATYIDVSGDNPTGGWIGGVSSTGTFVKNAAMNDWSTGGDSGIPSGWAVENTTPSKKSTDVFQYIKNESDTPTPPAPVPYDEQYLTIESTSDNNTISWKTSRTSLTTTISASTDNGVTWAAYTATTDNGTTLATLNTGEKLLIKGENDHYATSGFRMTNNFFSSTNTFDVKGNVMSMISGDTFADADTLTDHALQGIFLGCTHLTSAENLILPATTLAYGCYMSMFQGCTSLTTAPELPCMNLDWYCYDGMFQDCTSLTTAPELPALNLARFCYQGMFRGCSSLNYIKCLTTDVSATSGVGMWVDGVAASGTFVKNASATWPTGTYGIPSGWTVQNDAN